MRIDELENAIARIIDDASSGRAEPAWIGVEVLLRAQPNEERIALALLNIVQGGHLPIERALTVLAELFGAHSRNELIVGLVGQELDRARDIDLLNAPPPEHPLFLNVVSALTEMLKTPQEIDTETQLLRGLSTAARMMARQRMDVRELLHQIDQAIEEREPCRIYVPDLCEAAGLLARASFERRRFDMITGS
jgi:hypothetical protein